MIIEQLHSEVKRKWDMLGNNVRPNLSDLEVDVVLNTAIFLYTEYALYNKNPRSFNFGFETTQQRLDMLQTLVVAYPEQPEIDLTPLGDNIYRINFLTDTILPLKSLRKARVYDPDCKAFYNVFIYQHDDLDWKLKDYHYKPSKAWKRAVGVIRNDSLYVYTNGEYSLTKARITYIKKPNEVALGTYTIHPTIEEPFPIAIKPQVECDLPEDYHYLIVDLAVEELSRIYLDVNRKNLQTEKIVNLS